MYKMVIAVDLFNPTLDIPNIIGLIIGIVGILLSVYFYRKSKKTKEPTYRKRSTTLIRSAVSGIDSLEVYYDKHKLTALTITKFAFWNSGRETISGDDVSSVDPLRLEIQDGYEILSCDTIVQAKDANNFLARVADDKKSVLLSFDFIDFEEGAVLRIRHTGSSSEDLSIKGSIKGVKSIINKGSSNSVMKKIFGKIGRRGLLKWLTILATFLLAFMTFAYSCKFFFADSSFTRTLFSPVLSNEADNTILAVITMLLMTIFWLWYSIHFFKRPVPKSLAEVYVNDTF